MPLFVTDYFVEKYPVSTTLWADDHHHATELTHKRGFGEIRQPFPTTDYSRHVPCSVYIKKQQFPKAIHAANWLCMIACSAKVIEPWELFNDIGLMHDLSHIIALPHVSGVEGTHTYCRVLKKALSLECKTPGMLPTLDEDRYLFERFINHHILHNYAQPVRVEAMKKHRELSDMYMTAMTKSSKFKIEPLTREQLKYLYQMKAVSTKR